MSIDTTTTDLASTRWTNNFTLLRLVAALGVVISHTILITEGRAAVPSSMWLLGHVCVGIFFAISGYLISGSWDRAASALDFAAARALRIFPALAACVLLTALVIGPAVSNLSLQDYFSDPKTTWFILGNLTLFFEVETLPGVFTDHPVPDAQITLWSLKHEMVAYLAVLALGIGGILRSRQGFALFAIVYAVLWTMVLRIETVAPDALPAAISSFQRVSLYFVFGMMAHRLRSYLLLSGSLCLALLIATLAAWWTPAFHFLLPLTVAYAALWFALVPKGLLLRFNAIGDYSYGVYIFAIPIQQLCVTILGPHGAAANFAYAIGPTLLLAVLSWHLIEKPSLALRASRSNRPWPAQPPVLGSASHLETTP